MKRKNKTQKKRWLVIGPGLILALIFAVQIAITKHQEQSTRPIIENRVISRNPIDTAKQAMEISFMTSRADKLGLTEEQSRKLSDLQSMYTRDSRPLKAELDAAAKDFQAYMDGLHSKASMKNMQPHMGRVSELSRRYAELRSEYWSNAMLILNTHQREILKKDIGQLSARELPFAVVSHD